MHICNLQALVTEMYKVSKGMAPKTFADILSSNSHVSSDLHCESQFSRPLVKSVFNGTETISIFGSTIFYRVLIEAKQVKILDGFQEVY